MTDAALYAKANSSYLLQRVVVDLYNITQSRGKRVPGNSRSLGFDTASPTQPALAPLIIYYTHVKLSRAKIRFLSAKRQNHPRDAQKFSTAWVEMHLRNHKMSVQTYANVVALKRVLPSAIEFSQKNGLNWFTQGRLIKRPYNPLAVVQSLNSFPEILQYK